MPRPYVTPAEYPFDMVRLACTKCGRRGHYRKATLLERYGPDKNMVELRLELAAGCPKIAANKIMDLCGVYYPDPDRAIALSKCCAFATVRRIRQTDAQQAWFIPTETWDNNDALRTMR